MKGRKSNNNPTAGTDETTMALRKSTRSHTETSNATEIKKPKPLAVIHGKRAGTRLDKPSRGKIDANAYKKGGSIHIKPSHEGLLTKEVGKEGLKPTNLRKGIARAKKEGDTALEKREVFALNAKTKFHH